MSHWAEGWALRQKLGDPVAKNVLRTMCYVMKDEVLLVYVGIPTLVEYTEYDDRTVRSAIARLANRLELGMLLDTGRKKNNVTVWRIPAYEDWLRRQIESPLNHGRASDTDLRALAQVAEMSKEKTAPAGADSKPLQKGEGTQQALPSSPASPPIEGGQALPKTGANLLDLSKSPKSYAPGFNETASRSYWWNHAVSMVLGMAGVYGLCKSKPTSFKEFRLYDREHLIQVCRELTAEAVDCEGMGHPIKPFQRRKLEDSIESRIVREMHTLRPPTPAEAASKAANN